MALSTDSSINTQSRRSALSLILRILALPLAALLSLLAACGKAPAPEAPDKKESAAPATPAAEREPGAFVVSFNEPKIPEAADHSQAQPGPDDGDKANRAGYTRGTTSRSLSIEWVQGDIRQGQMALYAKAAHVDYAMNIDIAVSSLFQEASCPYRVTWEHELSHARAFVSIFSAVKVHLTGALEHSQTQEPILPTRQTPRLMKVEDIAAFERGMGEKIRAVVEDQARVMAALMEDHRRDRDSPQAYRIDYEKCPAWDWEVGR